MNKFKNKKIIIMGLGSYENGSGISAAIFFAKSGAKILITDFRKKEELKEQLKKLKKFKNITYVLGGHREKDFKGVDFILKNPAVPKNSKFLKLAKKNKIPIHNDWSIFLENYKNLVVGVTGTRGKSTTTTLINEILKTKYKTRLCGNIGVSPLAIFSKIKKDDIIVAELSSWLLHNLKTVKKSPSVAVITNLMPDHLDKYKNLKDYYEDKKNIFRYQTKDDILILNKDNKDVVKFSKYAQSRIFWFSKKSLNKKEDGVFLEGDDIFLKLDEDIKKILNIKKVKLRGEHNKENILAAVLVSKLFKVRNSNTLKIIDSFSGISDRLEFIGSIRGVKFYNDTTATSPDATLVALKTLGSKKRNIILLAGGSDKKLEYKKFAKELKRYVKGVVLFSGEATEKIKKELKKINYKDILAESSTMKDAVGFAKNNAKKGDIILLSPGAASFGIFKNEFDRGMQFSKFVNKLK